MDPLARDAWRDASRVYGREDIDVEPSSVSDRPAELDTPNRGGAGTHLTEVEKREIRLVFLTERLSVSALARRVSRTREAIAACLKGPDYELLEREVNAQAAKLALTRLQGSVEEAAEAWTDSLTIAARKGDHRPAKDLLLHTKVIEPVGEDWSGPKVIVQIGVKDSDVQVSFPCGSDARLPHGGGAVNQAGHILERTPSREGQDNG